jgi:hypothetical protein
MRPDRLLCSGSVQTRPGTLSGVSARVVVGTAAVAVAVAVLAGCGGSSGTGSSLPPPVPPSTTKAAAPPPPPSSTTSGSSSPGALQGEAGAAATGDIPDNQVFLVFRNGAAGYSIKYPEGWAQNGSGSRVTFRDKNNIVRVLVGRGFVSAGSAARELRIFKGATITQQPQALTISGAPAVKAVYTTVSAPNPVTGKRVTLTVDRYYLGHAGREAIVDLGTPVGVDNVDAYRLMILSFRWR